MHIPPLVRPPAHPLLCLLMAGQIQRPRTITTTSSSTSITRGYTCGIDIYHGSRRTLALFCKARLFPCPAEGLAGTEL